MTWSRTARLPRVTARDSAHPDLIPPISLSGRMAGGLKVLASDDFATTFALHRLHLRWDHDAVGSRHANIFHFLSPCCTARLLTFARVCTECGSAVALPEGSAVTIAVYHQDSTRIADNLHSATALEDWLHFLYPAYDVLALALLHDWVCDSLEDLIAAAPTPKSIPLMSSRPPAFLIFDELSASTWRR